jgi:hypothetical protein
MIRLDVPLTPSASSKSTPDATDPPIGSTVLLS